MPFKPPQILINFLKTILQFNFTFNRHVKNANDNNVFDLGQYFTFTPGFGKYQKSHNFIRWVVFKPLTSYSA